MERFEVSILTFEEIPNVKIPEVEQLKDVVENNFWHVSDTVYNHTMNVYTHLAENIQYFSNLQPYLQSKVSNLNREQVLGWATLLHDIAKPDTIQITNGQSKCENHEEIGATKASAILKRLGMEQGDIDRITKIIKYHGIPHSLLDPRKRTEQIDEDINVFLDEFQDISTELLLLGLSDTEGSQAPETDQEGFAFRLELYHELIGKVS